MTDNKWECISIEVETDSYIDFFVCPRCSSLVKDQQQHNNWHVGAALFGG